MIWFPVIVLCAVSSYSALANVCPSGTKTCSQGMTCCELPSGEQGCCPYENATCCADKIHCCPNGFYCGSGRCRHEHEDEIYAKQTRLMVEYEEPTNSIDDDKEYYHPNASLMTQANNRCPDGNICAGEESCCQMSSGKYGCCPFDDGVCCSDHKTCCPAHTVCTAGGFCEQHDTVYGTSKMPAGNVKTICPGGHQSCRAGETCCPHGAGWSCCPLNSATCCSDQLHCCPHGYRCDGRGYCTLLHDEI